MPFARRLQKKSQRGENRSKPRPKPSAIVSLNDVVKFMVWERAHPSCQASLSEDQRNILRVRPSTQGKMKQTRANSEAPKGANRGTGESCASSVWLAVTSRLALVEAKNKRWREAQNTAAKRFLPVLAASQPHAKTQTPKRTNTHKQIHKQKRRNQTQKQTDAHTNTNTHNHRSTHRQAFTTRYTNKCTI